MVPLRFPASSPAPPTEDDLEVARFQGRRVTEVAAALKSAGLTASSQ